MQTVTFEHLNRQKTASLKTENQYEPRRRDNLRRQAILTAVREWELTLPGQAQDVVTQLVAEQWAKDGGRGITVNKQNLYRYLKNETNSSKYTAYVMKLANAISMAMPIEIARKHGLRQGKTDIELVADAIKECGEHHQAKLLGLPTKKQAKEGFENLLANAALLPGELAGVVIAHLQALSPLFT
ncbi:toxin YdaT family protein [Leclercia sp.]|uniref:toxin YdaT family protein n=1 Tax=Leclercia sp. TaxID=1898428 RepID=UPI00289D9D78|nr:toxin YdaT family protein [Leclercia sp.]